MPDQSIPKPRDAMAFLKRKKVVIKPGNEWFDINSGEHAQTFSVAHCSSMDIAEQIFGFMNEALENGESFGDFKKNMLPMMQKSGWYGRDEITAKDKDYINWRLRIMYDTNMSTAYAAGHYRQQMRGAEGRPYLVYKQVQRPSKRDEHEKLHNTAYPVDHLFWDEYYPPNGYRCGCYAVSISESQYRNGPYKKGASGQDLADFKKSIDEKWRYNPGQEVFAPSVKRYGNLRNIQMNDGRSAYQHVRESYRKEMSGFSLTQKEYEKWIDKVLSGDTFQDVPHNIATVQEDVIRKIEIDPKIIADGKAIHHGSRGRGTVSDASGKIVERAFDPEKDFTIEDIKAMPRGLADPDYIFSDITNRQNRIFCYLIEKGKLARLVLRKRTETSSLKLVTFQKVKPDDVLKNGRLNRVYEKWPVGRDYDPHYIALERVALRFLAPSQPAIYDFIAIKTGFQYYSKGVLFKFRAWNYENLRFFQDFFQTSDYLKALSYHSIR